MTAGALGSPADGETLTDVLERLGDLGFAADIVTVDGGALKWRTCGHMSHASAATIEYEQRLEGASDPDDMMLVAALRCPVCGAGGTAVLHFGPEASEQEAEVLAALAGR